MLHNGTKTAGGFYGGTTDPTNPNRTNYDGYLYATRFYGPLYGNASSATKLATARTINGTSFDGTEDITTANWGTARNITIGSTTRSVNGSTNYTWTLADIGAMPATGNGAWRQNSTWIEPYINGAWTSNIRLYANGKIDVAKVDPVVEIGGEKYATYGWDGVGLRTDIVGVGELVNGEFRIDLAKQPKASDHWLFYNVVAEGSIVPFVTPQDPVILMARMEGTEFVVKSISGEENARFSYRLSGIRIDMVDTEEEINRRKDDPPAHIKVDDFDRHGNKIR